MRWERDKALRAARCAAVIAAACVFLGLVAIIALELDRVNANLAGIRETLLQPQKQTAQARPADGRMIPVRAGPEDPTLGDPQAPAEIVMLIDFECPYCEKFHADTFAKLKAGFADTGKARIVFRHYPLKSHANAIPAAKAAECARRQGKFWEMFERLLTDRDDANPARSRAAAVSLGLDMPAYDACFASAATGEAVTANEAFAEKWGIAGTPAFLINKRLFIGARSYAEMSALLESKPSVVKTQAKDFREMWLKDATALSILDVRSAEEFKTGHIPGAVNLDVNKAEFPALLETLPKSELYLVYCKSGARSDKASAIMSGAGFLAVMDMQGGITAWTAEGYPVQSSP